MSRLGWTPINLASVVATLESGSRPQGGAGIGTGEIPSLGGENILQSGRVTLSSVKHVPAAFFHGMTKGHLADRDVLINKDGAQTGKVGIYVGTEAGPACINEHLFLIRGQRDRICQDYLYFILLSEQGQRQIAAQISGSAQPGLKSNFLSGVVAEIPDCIDEQASIASVLLTVDRAIEQTDVLISKQRYITTGLMQALLTRGIDEHGQVRSEHTHMFKNSPIGRIPVEWEVTTLDSVSEFVTSGSRGWAQYYAIDGALFLRIGNLTREHINLRLDELVRVDPPKSSEGERTSASPGDLLISITADLGIIGVIPAGFETVYVNQHIALVRILQEKADPRFLGWFLSSRAGQAQFEALNESGAKAGLNLPTVRQLLIPTLTLLEQERIAAALDASTQHTDVEYQRLAKLRSLKAGLMQDLLTGRVRVTSLLAAGEEAVQRVS